MSEQYEIKFQYVNPSNIESEVPEQQTMREDFTENDETQPSNDVIQVMEESTLVPVMTVTKQEAEYTKGDVKLQKVSVTETISDNENEGSLENPGYSLITSEVIESQPFRTVPELQDPAKISKEVMDQTEPKKIQTRIPKFKQTVEKVQREKKDTEEKKGEEVPPTQKRRSSIPKLNKNSKIPSAKETNVRNEAKAPLSVKNDPKNISAEKTRNKTLSRGIPLPVKDKNAKKHTELPASVKNIVNPENKEANLVEKASIEEDTKDATSPAKTDLDTPLMINKSKAGIPSEETISTDIIITGENEEEDEFDKIYDEQDKIEEDMTDATQFVNNDTITTTTIVYKSNEEIPPEETNATDIMVAEENEAEDEFDKMYDEIFDTKQTEANEEKLTFEDLEPSLGSSPRFEKSFEDIIHAYDENDAHPIVTDKMNSAKPSLHEVVIPRQVPRRLSLEDVSDDNGDISQNKITEVGDEKDLVHTNDFNLNKMGEQNVEQHSMIYTVPVHEKAQFQIMPQLPEKEDNDSQLMHIHNIQEPIMTVHNDNESAENEATNLDAMTEKLNKTVHVSDKDETVNHESETSIIQQELKETVKVATLDFNDENIILRLKEIENIQTPAMRIQDMNYSNINAMEEENIEQHSMIYTNEPAQFEIMTHSSDQEDDNDTQLIDIHDIQEPITNTQDDKELTENEVTNLKVIPQLLNENIPLQDKDETTENEPTETNIIEQELKQTVEVATIDFQDENVNQGIDINSRIREVENIQEPAMEIQDTNYSNNINTIQEENIEQHSMIYINEPAQFEKNTHLPDKEDDNVTQLIDIHDIQEPITNTQDNKVLTENEVMNLNIISQQLNENIPVQDKDETTENKPIETNIIEQELEQTVQVATIDFQDENVTHGNDINSRLREVENNQEPAMEIQDTNYYNRMEEENIEHHSMIYTNEPAQFEIISQLPEKEQVDIRSQFSEVDNIYEPPISIQNDSELPGNEATILNINSQQSNETIFDSEIDETIEHEPEETNVIQEELKETVKVATPEFKDDNVNQKNWNLLARDDIPETKYTDHVKPKLENQKSNSEVPDSSQMVLNIISLIRNNQNNKDAPDPTEESFEKEVPVSQEADSNDKISTKINKNESSPVQEHSTINKIDYNDENVQIPQKRTPPLEIPKTKPVQSKIAVLAGDKGTSQKEKAIKPQARALITNTTKKVHRDVQPETKTKVKAPVVHKLEQSHNKALDPVNIKHVERNKQQSHSKLNSKNDTHMLDIPKQEELNAANSEIENVMQNNSTSRNILPVQSEDKNNNRNDTFPESVRGDIDNEETPIVRGKVSNIISRLGSRDESKETPKKAFVNEIPKKKSVSSRIAMFEDYKQQSPKYTPVPKLSPGTKITKPFKETDSSKETVRKPKVIDELLKPQQVIDNTDTKYDEAKVEIIRNEAIFTAGKALDDEIGENLIDDNVFDDKLPNKNQSQQANTAKVYTNKSKDKTIPDLQIPTVQAEKPTESGEFEPKALDNEIARPTRNLSPIDSKDKRHNIVLSKAMEMPSIESRLQRMRSLNEQTNIRRTKSVAELDLGDAVKGRVHQMIVRINSTENLLDVGKKEINVMERPRKRSVSDKIALFERKLTPVNMADPAEARGVTDSRNPKKLLSGPETLTESEYHERVAELTNAKIKYGRMDKMVCITLRDGTEMPALAVGTALLNRRLIQHVIGAALDLGYRSIDTAYIYGNEREVGEAIRAKIDDGTVTREDLFITSKLWSTFHRQDLVEAACKASLAAMGLDYFDLYLIHNPMSFKEGGDPIPKIANVLQYSESDYMDAWYGMERLVTKGLVKSIGLSNFNSAQLSRVHEKGRVKPVVNQVECHPYLNQQRLEQSCGEREVRLSCFGVLGSKGTPGELKGHQSPVIDDPLVKVMAAAMNVSPAQLLVRYQIEGGHSVVVKSSSAAHLWDNLQAMAFNISSTELDALNALNRNKRTYTFKGMGDTHRNYPFRAPY